MSEPILTKHKQYYKLTQRYQEVRPNKQMINNKGERQGTEKRFYRECYVYINTRFRITIIE